MHSPRPPAALLRVGSPTADVSGRAQGAAGNAHAQGRGRAARLRSPGLVNAFLPPGFGFGSSSHWHGLSLV
ncbi:hypothetical protein chiPu_0024540, partial [Chiloscyllium punctatum]|nr:hypothetical protein [Chiloscyllium punctatum]